MPSPEGLLFKVIKRKIHDATVFCKSFFLQLNFTNAHNREQEKQNNLNVRVQHKRKSIKARGVFARFQFH